MCPGLPVCPELTRDTIPRSRDVGHFLSVTGTVIRTSVAKVTALHDLFSFQQFAEIEICLSHHFTFPYHPLAAAVFK